MATFATLKTRVNRRVIDLPAAVQAEVPTLVNEAIRDLERDHNFHTMATFFQGSTLVNTVQVIGTFPTNIKELRKQPYSPRNLGGVIKLKTAFDLIDIPPDITMFGGPNFPNTQPGQPQIVIHSLGVAFFISPTADGNSDYDDGEYPIYIPYWKYLPDLVNDGDSNWFTNNAERFIIEWASAQAFGLDWDEEHMAILLQKAEVERTKVVKADKVARLGAVNSLAVHLDDYDSNLRT